MALLESDILDAALDSNGDVVIDDDGVHFISGIPAIVQLARIRMLMFLGEWFLNMGVGIPYYQELLGDASKTPGVEARAHAVFAAAILDTPGIVEILSLVVKVDRATRKMFVTWSARTLFGDTLPDVLGVP